MRAAAQFRKGIRKAIRLTDTSSRQASLKSGYNQHQINRFLSGDDIKLETLQDICTKGFGMTFETIYRMGK